MCQIIPILVKKKKLIAVELAAINASIKKCTVMAHRSRVVAALGYGEQNTGVHVHTSTRTHTYTHVHTRTHTYIHTYIIISPRGQEMQHVLSNDSNGHLF